MCREIFNFLRSSKISIRHGLNLSSGEFIPQRFRQYGGGLASDYQKLLPRIQKQIIADVATVLRRIDASLASNSLTENRLGMIKDFGRLAVDAQKEGKAIWEVGNPAERTVAEKAFGEVADNIIRRSRD